MDIVLKELIQAIIIIGCQILLKLRVAVMRMQRNGLICYGSIIEAGTHKTKNIKVAEAAKVIENTQRDINIALINELAIIFDRLNINTQDVLNAAATKWNFQYFKPGLVGGHCIGVDPYYLTFKSEEVGYYPEMVLAGRRINNSMASFVVQKLVMELIRKNIINGKVNILILGLFLRRIVQI